jgi:hypothetical protein
MQTFKPGDRINRGTSHSPRLGTVLDACEHQVNGYIVQMDDGSFIACPAYLMRPAQ